MSRRQARPNPVADRVGPRSSQRNGIPLAMTKRANHLTKRGGSTAPIIARLGADDINKPPS